MLLRVAAIMSHDAGPLPPAPIINSLTAAQGTAGACNNGFTGGVKTSATIQYSASVSGTFGSTYLAKFYVDGILELTTTTPNSGLLFTVRGFTGFGGDDQSHVCRLDIVLAANGNVQSTKSVTFTHPYGTC